MGHTGSVDVTGGMPRARVLEVVGVYDADGSLWGEVRYVIAKVRGTAHCSLCDTTHSGWRRRSSWDQMVARLGVPMRLVHLDERDEEIARVSGATTPCVLARVLAASSAGVPDLVVLLGPQDLEQVAGDPAAFERLLRDRVSSIGAVLDPV